MRAAVAVSIVGCLEVVIGLALSCLVGTPGKELPPAQDLV